MSTLTKFKSDLKNDSLSNKEIIDKYIFTGNPFIFGGDDGLYSSLKSKLSLKYKVEITKVFMVGSAKLGFSIARKKLWKSFDDDSDIDMVIISEELFDNLWIKLSDLSHYHYV